MNRKRVVWVLFTCYCLFILWVTILSRGPSMYSGIRMDFLWSYRALLDGDPQGWKYVNQNISNIGFFIPFGMLMPKKTWKSVLTAAFCLSLFVEIVQAVTSRGLCELDDVLCNVLGAMLGFWICTAVKKIFK